MPSTAARIAKDLEAIQHAGDEGADKEVFADAELERLTKDVYLWCAANSEVIFLPEGYDFWSDVPVDAIG